MDYHFYPLGDQAVMIELGKTINIETQQKVKTVAAYFDEHPIDWFIEYVPAFTTVTVFYDPIKILDIHNLDSINLPYNVVCEYLEAILTPLVVGEASKPRVVDIPVYYGGEAGSDIEYVAEHNGLTVDEVIDIHSGGDYLVYMIGFAPGFPYIGGMSESLATPRRSSPRTRIPAGSVGIAGRQTGVYPIETPGGWQLIGKTPLKLFQPNKSIPSLLQAGDHIRFKPISFQEYQQWEENSD
ncbi:5-oxoprolinase subunit PxpB [Tuberibacillus sp. Marseille-P3662]|uniref:5-oxoprolinase subunit PxpB n=1 Tax=Tuberibacillus sp. Marseille-P3662 TaxID=1965358 RepID=UPI000A1CDB06|nr:5-oxoprolinase subunit PxpB [Tuberibacillus sp. Marseille-P3662]